MRGEPFEPIGADAQLSDGERRALDTLRGVAIDTCAATAAAMGLTLDERLEGKSFAVAKVDDCWVGVVLRAPQNLEP